MSPIHFFSEEIPFVLKHKTKIRKWIEQCVLAEGFRIADVSYIFCSDAYLLEINRSYLNHDTYTDIITFDNSEDEQTINSDIFISIERIRENAKTFGVNNDEELRRVMIHGILHLCGYPDKTQVEKAQMRGKENHYLLSYQ